jgi:hypothetical protein
MLSISVAPNALSTHSIFKAGFVRAAVIGFICQITVTSFHIIVGTIPRSYVIIVDPVLPLPPLNLPDPLWRPTTRFDRFLRPVPPRMDSCSV